MSSRPPWVSDPAAWGRVRFTERMAEASHRAIRTYLRAMHRYHATLPNPSPESRQVLEEIRELQKVLRNLEGLAEEKEWAWLAFVHGDSPTQPTERPSSTTSTTPGSKP